MFLPQQLSDYEHIIQEEQYDLRKGSRVAENVHINQTTVAHRQSQ